MAAPHPDGHRRWLRRVEDQSGQAFVETALVILVVMMLALGLLQFGLWFHAQHVVLGAAQDGAHVAALQGDTSAQGKARAEELVRAGLGDLARDVTVSSGGNSRVVIATVTADLPPVVPFLPSLRISAEARAFRERFVPAGVAP